MDTIKNKNNRLYGILKDLHQPKRYFMELGEDPMEKAGACFLRSEHYENRNVTNANESKETKTMTDFMDAFDKDARFFLLKGGHDFPKPYLILRTVNRNQLGILPSELSLHKQDKLIEICKRKGICENKISDSTMSENSKEKLTSLIEEFEGSKTFYEIGGLCGNDKSRLGIIGFIYLIARTAYLEKWDVSLQTCHPRHVGIYLSSGLPYRTIHSSDKEDRLTNTKLNPYKDYLGRSAITLYLRGEDIQKKFPELEKTLFGK
ncbi:Uncharacterised protein [uncultured archaeon]|nr:Uncharacterised protein [uncultured archaeon]